MPANRFRLLGFLLLLVVLNTQALTLGRLRGVALVGQALDVSVQVRIDPDESPASLCFEADVFHADTRQQPSRVQVSVEPTQIAQTVNLRVQSPGLVDEPVVTVYLRAGCAEKTSRRYVLLADVVSEQLAPDAPRLVPVPLIAPLPSAAGSGTANASSRSTAAALGKVGAATARAPVARRTGAARKPWPVARSKAATVGVSSRKPARPKTAAATPAQDAEKLQAGRTAGQSRLKLDPIEVLSDHPATPASSAASAPVDGAARDAREAQRVESLETSLKNLTALSSRNESSLADLKGRLQRVESERYLNPVVYGLFALLLASLAAVGFLLNQRRRQIGGTHANWWSGSTGAQPMRGPGETGHEPAQPSGFSPLAAPGALAARGTAVEPAQLTQAAAPRSIPA